MFRHLLSPGSINSFYEHRLDNYFPYNFKSASRRSDIEKVGSGRWRVKAEDRNVWEKFRETFALLD